MIGVIANSGERELVREFFELFKTPWEFYRTGRRYDVVLCAERGKFDESAKLVIVYAGGRTPLDDRLGVQTEPRPRGRCILSYQADRIPIYGDTLAFLEVGDGLLTDEDSGRCVAYVDRSDERVAVRIGYDLFGEIRVLLTEGQPAANAGLPALELHIALLRDLIGGCGIPLAEIPAVPTGYRFIACLTHDIDHPSIRLHKWDHTALGFLYRAIFGSVRNFVRGRLGIRGLAANWVAAFKLPFVHLGLAKDFWRDFAGRYLELERGVRSTFFVIPFKNRPGKEPSGVASGFRAARYGARDIADTIQKLLKAGCEIALHGIDAWIDPVGGREELEELRRLTGGVESGVRMHWLKYDETKSPQVLEKAGASYDSTIGYNQTVGYRAGTTQAYQPLGAHSLLELPLHAMDTALFYPAYRDLSPEQARAVLRRMVDIAVRFGGCLTVNWHDRSLAPERLWGACYEELVQELKNRGAWFATAGQAVAWFRKRRDAQFVEDDAAPGGVRALVAGDRADDVPGFECRNGCGTTSAAVAATLACCGIDR